MKTKLYKLIITIAALVSVSGCGDSFYAAYDDLTGPVESVYIPATATIFEGKTLQLDAEVYPSLTANKKVTWSVTNGTGSVTVDQNGVITGVSVGTATVTVTTDEGRFTATCTVTVAALTAPDAPGAPTVTDGVKKITANWSAVSGATAYEIWYRTTDGATDLLADGNVSGLTYTITGLAPDKYYYVWVKAKNSAGTSAYSSPATSGMIAAYALRDTGPAGGLIFYIKSDYTNGWRYMEAAPGDQASGVAWSSVTSTSVTTGTAIGDGVQNTANIITQSASSAANYCKGTIAGYSDWFLPSKDECYKMYVNLKNGTDENGLAYTPVGDFANAFYWSSSQNNSSTAYVVRFTDGLSAAHAKDGSFSGLSNYRVRAARRF